MDSSNHWYGHAHIFAKYCGLDVEEPPTIWGVLQHGWNILHGFGPGHAPPSGFPKFVWSAAALDRGRAYGWSDLHVIGAPWAYLMAMHPDAGPAADSGTMFYPFHAWEESKLEGDHNRLIDEIRNSEEGPVTACLYFLEYRNPEIRKAYEKAGFRVICHGERGTFRQGTDSQFLYRQFAEISSHRRVISNRLSTAIFYGAALGRDVGVYGDPMKFVEVRSRSGKSADNNEILRSMMPEMHGRTIDPAAAQSHANRELGIGAVAQPEEIRLMFGWEQG